MKLFILITLMIFAGTVFAQGSVSSGAPVTKTMDGAIARPAGQPNMPTLQLPPVQPQLGVQPIVMPLPPQPGSQETSMDGLLKVLNPIVQALSGGSGGGGNGSNPGERMAGTEGDYGFPYASSASGGYVSGVPNTSASGLAGHSNRGFAPIVEPFKIAFPQCTEKVGLGTCQFVMAGIWGDRAHQARQSCHNAGEAIDVGLPFQCSKGGKVDARDPRALEVARCMANNQNGKFGVIFQDRSEPPNIFPGGVRGAHNGHMHIQLRYCKMVRG